MNCWEFKNCDFEIRYKCRAYLENRGLDCWKVNGTKCDGGKIENLSLKEKIDYCRKNCEFYKKYAHKF